MAGIKKKKQQVKISRLKWDIAQLSNALADDPQYDRHWRPRLERLLNYVSEKHEEETNAN